MEDGGGGQVAGQQAARVGQHRLGVDQRQHEEGDGPHAVEDLQQKIFKLEKNICNREQFNNNRFIGIRFCLTPFIRSSHVYCLFESMNTDKRSTNYR